MRFLKRVLVGLATVAVVLVAVAYLLPREVTVERSAVVAASPDAIFPYVNSMQKTQEWSPWLSLDPDVALAFSGPEEGVGNTMVWTSDQPNVGNGTQTIVESDPDKMVKTALDFGGQGPAEAAFILSPTSNGTEVTWTLKADMGLNPIGRYMGLMMDGWVGADYETGLSNLKTLAEGG